MHVRVIRRNNGLTVQREEDYSKPIIYLFRKDKLEVFFNPREELLVGRVADLIVVNGDLSERLERTLNLTLMPTGGKLLFCNG